MTCVIPLPGGSAVVVAVPVVPVVLPSPSWADAERPLTTTPVGADSAAHSSDKGLLKAAPSAVGSVRALRTVPLN